MKKIIFLMLFAILGWQHMLAQTITIGGIIYNVTSPTTVEVGDHGGNAPANVTILPQVIYNSTVYAVTRIGDNAFADSSSMTSLSIPSSVTSIGNSAIYNCAGLTSVTIPDTVLSIGSDAISSCYNLTSVSISNSVTTISDNFFNGCSSLTSINIPNAVTSIGQGAFQGCSSLTLVTIPNSVTSIGPNAFYLCTSLTSVTIPDAVTSVGSDAFRGCTSLTGVTIGNAVTSIGDNAFQDCSSLTSVIIPNSVTSIGYNAFQDCSGLTSVTIPNSVTIIEESAFQGCSGLTSVICNIATPLSIATTVFQGVTQSTCSLKVPSGSVAAYQAADVWKDFSPISCITIDNTTTVTTSGSYTWANNGQTYTTSGIKTGTTTNCVTEKLNLTITTPPSSFTVNGIIYAVTSANTVSVANQNRLASGDLTIPAQVTYNSTVYAVTSIINDAFFRCDGLTSIIIPNSITSIGEGAFIACSGLISVTIPSSVTSIIQGTFTSCSSLTSVVIPSSVTSIGDSAFYSCEALAFVTIPNSVSSIGYNAFANCTGLTSVTCNVTTPIDIDASVFQDVNQASCSLTVPAGSVAAYQGAAVWQNFAPIVASNTTWNGTAWSNGTPTAALNAVIASDYGTNNGVITAKNLTVNAGVRFTVNGGANGATISEGIVNNGFIVVEMNANLIQTAASNTNTSGINARALVHRNSNPLKRLDYTLWSSPVSGLQTLGGFSPLTTPLRNYVYNPSTNFYNSVGNTGTFITGKGYLIRMPDALSSGVGPNQTNYYKGLETLAFEGGFDGTALNNGTVTISTTAGTYNAVGNPYPSTISAAAFLSANNTDGILYFWRKTNGGSGTAYAVYNPTVGSTGNGGVAEPNGTIQVGQGFIVKTNGSSLVFNNTMRATPSSSTQFFKTAAQEEKSRVWLNLNNADGMINQTLVGYLDGATTGIDKGIDGKSFGDGTIELASSIDGESYTIQGRPAFDATDVVALNFKTSVAGTYTIAIDKVDGLFSNGQTIVYIVDKNTGMTANLNEGAYSFTANAGVDNTRFTLTYQKTLKVDASVFNENTVKVFRKNGVVTVNSTSKAIKTIQMYDVQGRLVAQQKNVNAAKASFNNLKTASQVLIVKVIADDNTVVNKKVLN